MPGLDTAAVKIVAYGDIEGVQDWSTSVWVKGTPTGGPLSDTNMNSIADACEPVWNAWLTSLAGFASATTWRRGTKAYYYPSGATTAYSVGESSVDSPQHGTGAQYVPTQTSLVASFRTAVSNRSARGRSYFPATALPIAANGQITGANCVTAATAYALLLGDLTLAVLAGGPITDAGPVVASFKTGTTHQITHVIVDSIPDIQRRRADKLVPFASDTEVVTA